tara:strand:- start:33 stop:959 length:927 start_codon:yes stop_codon:yes gene_type:complete
MEFTEIDKCFDPDDWDLGHITLKQLKICGQMPLKGVDALPGGVSFNNSMSYNWGNICNGLVLVRHSSTSLDYSLYDEASNILVKNGLKNKIDWVHLYLNFKEASILSGRGVRARNSLVYNYKFGFDSKICVVGFMWKIQNPPKIKRVPGNDFKNKYWKRCIGCDDCRKACPSGAIRNKEEPYWLDAGACDDVLGMGSPNHPEIPSLKSFWHKNIHPEVPQEVVDKITSNAKDREMGGGESYIFSNWNANGHESTGSEFKKDGKLISILHCRECEVQPRCSKWGGKFPYHKSQTEIAKIAGQKTRTWKE